VKSVKNYFNTKKEEQFLSLVTIKKLKVKIRCIYFINIEFNLQKECIDLIKSLNSSFGVVSMEGNYRTGKSYLLNKMLLTDKNGFEVGQTVNACTKGLWIYSKPIMGINEDGENIPVLIIDSEGFGSLDLDMDHDVRIFSMCILISS
jgi:hypothetical protein